MVIIAIFNKKESIDWEENYAKLAADFDKVCEENRALRNQIKELESRIKKTGYLEPKERQISDSDILYIKTLKRKERLSYSSISSETGWSKATISRVMNGVYDRDED